MRKYACAVMAIAMAVAVGPMGGKARGATPIPIANAGFEDPVYADGSWGNGIPGWSAVSGGDFGGWNIQTSEFLTEAPEGLNVAWLYAPTDGQGFGQVLSKSFQSDAPYVLTVKVGLSLNDTSPGYQVQLLAGGTVIAEDVNTLTLAQGEWKTSTVTYTYNPAHSALVGEALEIRLLGKSPASQMMFDDVQLVYTPPADVTPPTLAGSAIADDKSGGSVEVGTLVTYTVTFSEAMDAGTVNAADFGNAGTAAVAIVAVIRTAPAVFTVQVRPTSAGALQLQVNAGAVLKDLAGNALDTASAIPDDTTLTVTAAVLPPGNTGSGGTITYTDSNGLNPRPFAPYAGGYVVHTFTSNDTLKISRPVRADVLVVAGGGAGGAAYNSGGGGGAGGLIYSAGVVVSGGDTTVTVGSGGTTRGASGGNSAFGTITAIGGGGGGDSSVGLDGESGGSGGGGASNSDPGVGGSGGAGTPSQGNAGAAGVTDWSDDGGGGGGAGAVGSRPNGGDGVSNAISGSAVWYAGGGGGAVWNGADSNNGKGGQGGGGAGGCVGWFGTARDATSGAPNTGGGGGGGDTGGDGPVRTFGAGGSGIVIVRYRCDASTGAVLTIR